MDLSTFINTAYDLAYGVGFFILLLVAMVAVCVAAGWLVYTFERLGLRLPRWLKSGVGIVMVAIFIILMAAALIATGHDIRFGS